MAQPLRSKHLLRVYANPFAALDANGMPFGIVRHDPEYGRKGVVHFVGAATKTTYADPKQAQRAFALATIGDGPTARVLRFTTVVLPERKVSAEYELVDVDGDGKPDVCLLAVQKVEHTDYHAARIRDVELIPADEETAKLVRVQFRDPVEVINEQRALRIAEYEAAHAEKPPIDQWPTYAIPVPKAPEAPAPAAASQQAPEGKPVSALPAPAEGAPTEAEKAPAAAPPVQDGPKTAAPDKSPETPARRAPR